MTRLRKCAVTSSNTPQPRSVGTSDRGNARHAEALRRQAGASLRGNISPVKDRATVCAGGQPCRVIVVGDTCVSESGLAAIVGRDKRYQICGSAHGFFDAGELIRQHRPDVLLIEPFLKDRDGILWIKELAREYPRTRILVVSRQSEHVYAERALHAGAAGYWMKNGSPSFVSPSLRMWLRVSSKSMCVRTGRSET